MYIVCIPTMIPRIPRKLIWSPHFQLEISSPRPRPPWHRLRDRPIGSSCRPGPRRRRRPPRDRCPRGRGHDCGRDRGRDLRDRGRDRRRDRRRSLSSCRRSEYICKKK